MKKDGASMLTKLASNFISSKDAGRYWSTFISSLPAS